MWGKLSKRRDVPIPAKVQHRWSSAFVPTLQDRAESWAVPLSTQDWHERGEKTFPNGAEDGPLFSLWCASSKRVATSETPFHFLWSQFPTEAARASFFFLTIISSIYFFQPYWNIIDIARYWVSNSALVLTSDPTQSMTLLSPWQYMNT